MSKEEDPATRIENRKCEFSCFLCSLFLVYFLCAKKMKLYCSTTKIIQSFFFLRNMYIWNSKRICKLFCWTSKKNVKFKCFFFIIICRHIKSHFRFILFYHDLCKSYAHRQWKHILYTHIFYVISKAHKLISFLTHLMNYYILIVNVIPALSRAPFICFTKLKMGFLSFRRNISF